MGSPTNHQVHEMMKKNHYNNLSSKKTNPLQRVIESIDHALITEGGEGNEHVNETLIKPNANKWKEEIWEEYTSLNKNKTWVVTKLPNGRFLVGCKSVFKVKLKSIGSIDRYKAPFVTKGYSQMVGINYQETFSLVVKITSVRTLMAIVAEKNLELH
jgi:hypothetical protein